MILSLRQIEDIGAAVIQDFNKFFYCGSNALRNNKVRATPIDQFAREYLGLSVRFARLSADGRICGLTSYADAEYIIEEMSSYHRTQTKSNSSGFQLSGGRQGQKIVRQAPLLPWRMSAHIKSCFRWSPRSPSKKCRGFYSDRRSYSLRDLKAAERTGTSGRPMPWEPLCSCPRRR